MEANRIVRRIVHEFLHVVEPELRRTKPDGSTAYTTEILTGLCRAGRDLGFATYAAKVANEHRTGPEWLYDTTWLELDQAGRIRSVPLVAECEWGSRAAVEDDLQKLLVARATLRVMVHQPLKRPERKLAHRLLEWLEACPATDGDRYLLIAYTEDDGGCRFDFDEVRGAEPGRLPSYSRPALTNA